jgi:hypothetical protein
MQKAVLASLAFTIFSISFSFAQASDETITEPKKGQEIWTNLTPVFLMALDVHGRNPELNLMYKREIKEFLWLRAGGFFTPHQPFTFSGHNYQIIYGDSIMIQPYESRSGFFTGGRAGIEYRNSKNRLVKFIALDAMYRYRTSTRSTFERTYRLNSIMPYPNKYFDKTHIGEDNLVYREEISSHGFGSALVAGIYYPLGKKFALAAQTQIDFFIGKQMDKSSNFAEGVFKDWESSSFGEMNSRLLSEISLLYRFR